MFVSVTDLSSYLYCPRALYMRLVLGIKEKPNKAMVAGSVKHGVFEQSTRREKDVICAVKEGAVYADFLSAYSSSYIEALEKQLQAKAALLSSFDISSQEVAENVKPVILDEAKARAESVFFFAQKNNVYGFDLWQTIVPKVFSEIRTVSKALRLKGVIDKVELYPDKCIVCELKTGKAPQNGTWPSHRVQVAAYSMLAEERFNVPSNECVVNYISSGEKREISMNPYMKRDVISTTDKVIALAESKESPEPCTKANCFCKSQEYLR